MRGWQISARKGRLTSGRAVCLSVAPMSRFLRVFIPVLVLAALAAGGLALWRSDDALYAGQEWLFRRTYHAYDELIVAAGQRYHVDPMLVKAVVWRESRFDPHKVGRSGERGLMQVTDAAGKDWARSEKIETFVPTDLFDPKVNLEAGAWYVSKAAEHWKAQDDPMPFTPCRIQRRPPPRRSLDCRRQTNRRSQRRQLSPRDGLSKHPEIHRRCNRAVQVLPAARASVSHWFRRHTALESRLPVVRGRSSSQVAGTDTRPRVLQPAPSPGAEDRGSTPLSCKDGHILR